MKHRDLIILLSSVSFRKQGGQETLQGYAALVQQTRPSSGHVVPVISPLHTSTSAHHTLVAAC